MSGHPASLSSEHNLADGNESCCNLADMHILNIYFMLIGGVSSKLVCHMYGQGQAHIHN